VRQVAAGDQIVATAPAAVIGPTVHEEGVSEDFTLQTHNNELLSVADKQM
jgi:hypothetical protein